MPEETSALRVRDDGEPPPAASRPQLGELLVRQGLIDDYQLEQALREGTARGVRLGEIVVERGWASEDDVAKLLAEQWQLGYVERASIWFDADALGRLSREEAQRLEALPTRVEDGHVVVAVAEPTEERLAALREVIGEDTVVVVVPKTALDAGLRSELLAGGRSDTPVAAGGDAADDAEADEPPLRTTLPPRFTPAPVRPPARAPARAPSVRTPHASAADPETAQELLQRLQEASADAAELQARADDLATRLAELESGLAALAAAAEAEAQHEEQARIAQLEEQLAQRTELTERLKAQLGQLTDTLGRLD